MMTAAAAMTAVLASSPAFAGWEPTKPVEIVGAAGAGGGGGVAGGARQQPGLGGWGPAQAGRDRGGGGRRRRLRPDGADDAGRDPEEQSDEAADGGLAQGWGLGCRSLDVH